MDNWTRIFVVGNSGAGKTTLAKQYTEKYGLTYIDLDKNFNYAEVHNGSPDITFIKSLPEDNFIVDGGPYTRSPNSFRSVHENLVKHSFAKSCLIICAYCSEKDMFFTRIHEKIKAGNYQMDDSTMMKQLYYFYFGAVNDFDYVPSLYFDSCTNEFTSKEEMQSRLKWLLVIKDSIIPNQNRFKSILDACGYDKYYQDIEYINFIGKGTSYQSWDNIKTLCDWKGKSVADLSCFHGYFSFKICDMGGFVTGFDAAPILNIPRLLNDIYAKSVRFIEWSAGQTFSKQYDIALCLDSLQYYPDKELALKLIPANSVLFDVRMNDISLVEKYFNIKYSKKSHRTNYEQMILFGERK